MAIELHQLTAAIYLAACLAAGLGLALPAPRLRRAAIALLTIGAAVHITGFMLLHRVEPSAPLTDISTAVSFMACAGTVFFLLLLFWVRLGDFAVLVAPAAFLGAYFAALRVPGAGAAIAAGSGSWPHAHVLLASAGLSMLGMAGLAGVLFLAENRRLKAKRPMSRGLALPSLEALDRVNAAALAVGFPLLTLGVLTGMMWVQQSAGRPWTGSAHETWCAIAWGVYALLVVARFGSNQGSRRAAVYAVGGFAFLFFAVIGVELLA